MASEAYLTSLAVEAAATFAAPLNLNHRDFIAPAYFVLLKMDARSKIPLPQNTSDKRRLQLIGEVVSQISDEDAIADDEDSRFLHQDQLSPFAEAVIRDRSEVLNKLMRTLTSREENVLRMRFGFASDRELTLQETGQVIGITRERVRQVECKALRRMKHVSRSADIRSYIEYDGPETFNSNTRVEAKARADEDYYPLPAAGYRSRPAQEAKAPIKAAAPQPHPAPRPFVISLDFDPFDLAA